MWGSRIGGTVLTSKRKNERFLSKCRSVLHKIFRTELLDWTSTLFKEMECRLTFATCPVRFSLSFLYVIVHLSLWCFTAQRSFTSFSDKSISRWGGWSVLLTIRFMVVRPLKPNRPVEMGERRRGRQRTEVEGKITVKAADKGNSDRERLVLRK